MPHSQDKPLRYREILSILRKFGVQEIPRKGATRILHHPNINGKPVSYPMHVHNENQQYSRPVIRAIRDRFNISIENFYK